MLTNLILDGDDTLWENNSLFERAIEQFIDYLAHPTLSREQVREQLDAIERVNVRKYGYGVDGFELSLIECLEALCHSGPPTAEDRAAVKAACEPIRSHDIELLDGVPETLGELSGRNRLFLLTKGDFTEQTAKVDASGLAKYFEDVSVVDEKDPQAYRAFVERRSLTPDNTWMIGNSPRSDIRPALTAGLGAVLVPHPMTWSLELEQVTYEHPRFHRVTPFAALRGTF